MEEKGEKTRKTPSIEGKQKNRLSICPLVMIIIDVLTRASSLHGWMDEGKMDNRKLFEF